MTYLLHLHMMIRQMVSRGLVYPQRVSRLTYTAPEFAQERKRQEVVEALKINKKRKTQIERLEAQKAEIEKARDQALSDTYGEMARTFPEVLEAALSSILVGNKFLIHALTGFRGLRLQRCPRRVRP